MVIMGLSSGAVMASMMAFLYTATHGGSLLEIVLSVFLFGASFATMMLHAHR